MQNCEHLFLVPICERVPLIRQGNCLGVPEKIAVYSDLIWSNLLKALKGSHSQIGTKNK